MKCIDKASQKYFEANVKTWVKLPILSAWQIHQNSERTIDQNIEDLQFADYLQGDLMKPFDSS